MGLESLLPVAMALLRSEDVPDDSQLPCKRSASRKSSDTREGDRGRGVVAVV